jgi:hypothetical protein
VVRSLEHRGAHVHLNTQVTSAVDGHVVLSTGEELDAGLIVWTTGNGANPVIGGTLTCRSTNGACSSPGPISASAPRRISCPVPGRPGHRLAHLGCSIHERHSSPAVEPAFDTEIEAPSSSHCRTEALVEK